MKKTLSNLLLPLMMISIFSFSCKKDDDNNNNNNNNNNNIQPAVYNKYLVAGSYGDIINYEIDKANKKFKYTNETTGISDSGTFVIKTGANLGGIYEITVGNNTFFGIEKQDKMFTTSLPSGNQLNSLCFGITSEVNLSTQYSSSEIAGKYIWLLYQDIEDFLWGGYEILPNGTFTWQFGPADDNDFNESQHFAGAGSGTWVVSSTDPSRIIFTEGGVSSTGTVYPGKYMMIDNGPGFGFAAGIKYPNAPLTQASIAGDYKWLDVTPEGYLGVGNFSLPATGTTADYFYKYYNNPYASEGNDTMTNFRRSTAINNAFLGEDDWDGDIFYTSFIVLPGEALLFFTWGDNGMVSYGIAAKIN
ncbi:MAG: hypothetical protein PHT69_04650 [Bacteroidales bacterium]|nr:hypothetical protein [Bacteroidales bacterium]